MLTEITAAGGGGILLSLYALFAKVGVDISCKLYFAFSVFLGDMGAEKVGGRPSLLPPFADRGQKWNPLPLSIDLTDTEPGIPVRLPGEEEKAEVDFFPGVCYNRPT